MRYARQALRLMLLVFGVAGAAMAHPGHGTTDPNTVTHYLAEPVHVAPMLALAAVTAVVISLLAARQRSTR